MCVRGGGGDELTSTCGSNLRVEINNLWLQEGRQNKSAAANRRFSDALSRRRVAYLDPELLHVALQLQGGVGRPLRSQALSWKPPLADEALLGLQFLWQLQTR